MKEVVNDMKHTANTDFQVIQLARRECDFTFLVANNSKILQKMKWEPTYNNLELIC